MSENMNEIDLTGKTVTLVGPMRGQPAFGHPAMDSAEVALAQRWGHITVHNPAAHDRFNNFFPEHHNFAGNEDLADLGFDLDKARRWCVARIAESDAVILLPGWVGSLGATFEEHLAGVLNIPRIELADALAPPAPAPLPEGWRAPNELGKAHGTICVRLASGEVTRLYASEVRRQIEFHDLQVVAWAELSAPPWDPEPEPDPWRPAEGLAGAGLDDDAEVLVRWPDGDIGMFPATRAALSAINPNVDWLWMPIPPYRGGE